MPLRQFTPRDLAGSSAYVIRRSSRQVPSPARRSSSASPSRLSGSPAALCTRPNGTRCMAECHSVDTGRSPASGCSRHCLTHGPQRTSGSARQKVCRRAHQRSRSASASGAPSPVQPAGDPAGRARPRRLRTEWTTRSRRRIGRHRLSPARHLSRAVPDQRRAPRGHRPARLAGCRAPPY